MLEKKKKIICVITGILFSVLVVSWGIHAKEERLQKEIAEEVLRFHVLANGNGAEDQELKLAVKDEVLSYMKRSFPEANDMEETKMWVEAHLCEIEAVARSVLEKHTKDYKVTAEVQESYFPRKTYGDITFPAGEYQALRILIGEAKGKNWWCVLYPNLCFLDAVHAVVPEEGKEQLREVLTEDAYDLVAWESPFRIRFFFFQK